MEITDFLKYPVRYDGREYCNYLLNSDDIAIGQILGWYSIKEGFKSKSGYFGKKREKAAESFLDEIGNFIADAINEKLNPKTTRIVEVYKNTSKYTQRLVPVTECCNEYVVDHYHHCPICGAKIVRGEG